MQIYNPNIILIHKETGKEWDTRQADYLDYNQEKFWIKGEERNGRLF